MFNELSPLSLNEKTINYPNLPGDANYNKNPTLFPSSSPPPRGCSGTASSVKAAEAKFIQSGGNYPYQYTGKSLGLVSGRMGHGEMERYNNSEFIKRSTNNYDNIFPHKMLIGGKKSKKMIGCKRVYGGKKRSSKKGKRSTKKRTTKKRSTKKRTTKKRSTKKRTTKKGIKKSKKTHRYRGGNSNVMPTFINEFNTTLSPDESGMASPTPLTRTPGDCTYIKY
jgi:hypothetical protein